MGVHPNIGREAWPKQGAHLGQRVQVAFNYETDHLLPGVVVRDDMESPHRTIIRLDDGRHALSTECQYRMATTQAPTGAGRGARG